MAFGIGRRELHAWKQAVARGEIALLTHFWIDERFPGMTSVTKVGCSDLGKLERWCRSHGFEPRYIHRRSEYPHLDLFGAHQERILKELGQSDQLIRFKIGRSG
ncbi:hypothetical protein HGI30_08625 [Paenibacillus albicereus]|uniref:YneQ n=1 Tax=Paenibacillus albicereus TaxID=2726185 RepID=A0A6H2GW76_9BACL|nr:hypothetical protein [Paenibacillus albicereus]QJC51609.1 hypothetical protein HGI30_08625 [Paenibacillus albicereus]